MTDERSGVAGEARAADEEAGTDPADWHAPEPWNSVMAALCGDDSAIASCCAPPAEREAGSATDDSGGPSHSTEMTPRERADTT